MKFLASDTLQGRGNGTPELDQAADYIASEFKASGLQPAGDGGSYFQKFTVTVGGKLGPANRLSVKSAGSSFEAAVARDFLPIGINHITGIPCVVAVAISVRQIG